ATAPFYALGGLEVVEAHFRAIAEATNLPLYAYDIPVCVNVKLPVDMLMRLAADGVIAGVKDSSGEDRKSTRLNSSHVSISYAVMLYACPTRRSSDLCHRPVLCTGWIGSS